MYQDEEEKELEASGFRVSGGVGGDDDVDTDADVIDEPPLFFDDDNEDDNFDKDR